MKEICSKKASFLVCISQTLTNKFFSKRLNFRKTFDAKTFPFLSSMPHSFYKHWEISFWSWKFSVFCKEISVRRKIIWEKNSEFCKFWIKKTNLTTFHIFFSSLMLENVIHWEEKDNFVFQNAKLPKKFGRLKLV